MLGCGVTVGFSEGVVVGCNWDGGKEIVGVDTEFVVKCGYIGVANGFRVDGMYYNWTLGGIKVELGIRVWLGFCCVVKVCG